MERLILFEERMKKSRIHRRSSLLSLWTISRGKAWQKNKLKLKDRKNAFVKRPRSCAKRQRQHGRLLGVIGTRKGLLQPRAELITTELQAPKTNCQPAKLATILNWFHSSAVAHNIKDLEKAIPSIASINGMQVKDYIQALTDENQVRVEKIGSGNWYWAFIGEELRAKETALAKAKEEHDKATAVVEDLECKIEEANAERQDGEDGDEAIDRAATTLQHDQLVGRIAVMKSELAGYSQNDPVEMDRRKSEATQLRNNIETLTDQIVEMEGYLMGKSGMDRETALAWKRETYGVEFSEEDEGLREL